MIGRAILETYDQAAFPQKKIPGARRNRQQRTQEPAAAEPRATGSEKRGPEPAHEPEVQVGNGNALETARLFPALVFGGGNPREPLPGISSPGEGARPFRDF